MTMKISARRMLPVVAMLTASSWATADLRDDIEAAIRAAELTGATIGISVRDCASNTSLVSIGAERPMIPASNMKLLTTGTALHVLGPEFQFRTRLVRDGDRLIVIGDGDPGFGDPELLQMLRLDDKEGLSVEEFVDLWVAPVAELGIGSISEVVVDDRVFDRERIAPGWPEDQLDRWYCAEVWGLNFHLNVLHFQPVFVANRRPDLSRTSPEAPWIEIVNRGTCLDGPQDRHLYGISRARDANRFTFFGNLKRTPFPHEPVTIHDTPTFFARMLATRLRERGLTVGGHRLIELSEVAPAGEIVGPVIRTPIETAITRCNRDSHNLYAEAILKRAAHHVTMKPGSWSDGAGLVRLVAHERIGDSLASAIVPVDGSGLSRGNRVAPEALTALLDSLAEDESFGRIFFDSLASAGTSGTLDSRFKNVELQGLEVRAKSGFINGVSCLSGFVIEPDGQRTAFSIMVNDMPAGKLSNAKALQERIVAAIALEVSRPATGLGG